MGVQPFDVLTEALARAFERGDTIQAASANIVSSSDEYSLATTGNFAVMVIRRHPSQGDLDFLAKHAGLTRQPIVIASDMSEAFFARASRLRFRCLQIELSDDDDMGAVTFYHPPARVMCTIGRAKVGLLEYPGVKDGVDETLDVQAYNRMLIRFYGEAPVEFSIGVGRQFKAGSVGKLPRREVVVMPSGTMLMLDVPNIPALPLYELHLDVNQGTATEHLFRPDSMARCRLVSIGGLERPLEFTVSEMLRFALDPGVATDLCHTCWRRCAQEQRRYVTLKRPLTNPITLPIVPSPSEGFMVCCIYCADALAQADQKYLEQCALALAASHLDDKEVMVSLGSYMMRLHHHALEYFHKVLEVGDVP